MKSMLSDREICNKTTFFGGRVLNAEYSSKAIVICNTSRFVPIKLLNPGNSPVSISKGTILSSFTRCDNSTAIFPVASYSSSAQQNDATELPTEGAQFEKFKSYFDFSKQTNLSQDQIDNQLYDCLYRHKYFFVTDESPNLGYTDIVKHKIHLQPDFIPKHQRPYWLLPDKKLSFEISWMSYYTRELLLLFPGRKTYLFPALLCWSPRELSHHPLQVNHRRLGVCPLFAFVVISVT